MNHDLFNLYKSPILRLRKDLERFPKISGYQKIEHPWAVKSASYRVKIEANKVHKKNVYNKGTDPVLVYMLNENKFNLMKKNYYLFLAN